MFVVDDSVHSATHGYGRVVRPGPNPLVDFVCGGMAHVAGSALRRVDDDTFDTVVANRRAIEEALHERVHGCPLPPRCWGGVRRTGKPLAVRLEEAARFGPFAPRSRSTGEMAIVAGGKS